MASSGPFGAFVRAAEHHHVAERTRDSMCVPGLKFKVSTHGLVRYDFAHSSFHVSFELQSCIVDQWLPLRWEFGWLGWEGSWTYKAMDVASNCKSPTLKKKSCQSRMSPEWGSLLNAEGSRLVKEREKERNMLIWAWVCIPIQ